MCWLFVYGTLKRGNRRSLGNMYNKTQFLTELTIGDYTLYKMPFRNAPVMVKAKGKKVKGELWKIPQELLKTLDCREGTEKGWYTRVEIAGFQVYIWKHHTWFFKHLGESF